MQLLVDCSGTTSRHWKGKAIGIEDIAQCRWLAASPSAGRPELWGTQLVWEPGLLGVPGGLTTQLKLGCPLCNRHKARVCAHDLFSLRPNGFIALLQI